MTTPLTILPEPAFLELRPLLAERLARIGDGLNAEGLASLLDPLAREVLQQGFSDAGAHEGTVWVVDENREHLVPAWNTGPHAERWVGKFQQPLNQGLISLVFSSEQPFLENQVFRNARQNKQLDSLLLTRTHAMIAVPFYLLGDCRGVVSCVQLKPPGSDQPDPPGFGPEHLAGIQRAVTLLSRLIEFRIVGRTVGWISG